MSEKVQRWTGLVTAFEGGGFVAYGDYLALQAQIAEQDHELADTAFLAGQYKAERDAALEKLRELEAQPTARTYMDGYSDGKAWALEEAAKVCEAISDKYHSREGLKYQENKTDAETGASDCEAAIRKLGEGL